ncbi:MAG: ABC transporter ATP-binding protein [Lentisphaerae bacterium]|jgi:ABC-2 type transport system ATP-binding protein|nr:ABC transporter ATP-binding protein [Lentisphaerota bacterium]
MLKANELVKTFGARTVVDNVSFTVARGEVLGFLGPNGAGKSTTIRMMTGYLAPTSGSASVGGFNVAENPVQAKRLFGYLPENSPLYQEMTVSGFLDFCAHAREMNKDRRKDAVEKVLQRCGLESVAKQVVGTLSKGYSRRTCFAQALLHDPQALFLDEPTDGLDPNQKHEMRNLIRSMARDKSILVSTHLLDEVEDICTRVIIIDHGRIVLDSPIQDVKGKLFEQFRKLTSH